MPILLLPGADGTGVLFQPLLAAMQKSGVDLEDVHTVNLNSDAEADVQTTPLEQTLSIQAQRIERQFGKSTGRPIIVIAESYSGLLAVELVKRQQLPIAQIILVASFVTSPSQLAGLGSKMNAVWLKTMLRLTPEVVWGRMLFGSWQTVALRRLFLEAIQQTPNQLLQQRLAIIAKAKLPNMTSAVPCLYLQAEQDNLVAKHSIKSVQQVFTHCQVRVLAGTHFLLQTNPVECWDAVAQELSHSTDCL